MELTINIPKKYMFFQSPEQLQFLLKLYMAMDLYRKGVLSVGGAIELIGDIDRDQFLIECQKRNIEPQTYEDINELESEVVMLDRELS